MSLTPTTPDLRTTVKSFWARPEGKAGMIAIGAFLLAIGSGIFFNLLAITQWLEGVAQNTVELLFYCGILFLMFFLVTNKKVRMLVRNFFQLSMRWITGKIVEIDPIGQLKIHLQNMIKKKREMEDAISRLAGSKQGLETNIAKKNAAIQKDRSLVAEIDSRMVRLSNSPQDNLTRQRYTLDRDRYLRDAGMKMQTADRLSKLLNQTDKMYNYMYRYGMLADHEIQVTANIVEEKTEERKALLAGYDGLTAAKRIIKGDPDELEMFNMALEYLADDAAAKLGEMEDFARYSEGFLDNMDIENGAAAAQAEKMFAEFEQKMLQSGSQNVNVIQTVQNSQGVYVPVEKQGDYSKYLKG